MAGLWIIALVLRSVSWRHRGFALLGCFLALLVFEVGFERRNVDEHLVDVAFEIQVSFLAQELDERLVLVAVELVDKHEHADQLFGRVPLLQHLLDQRPVVRRLLLEQFVVHLDLGVELLFGLALLEEVQESLDLVQGLLHRLAGVPVARRARVVAGGGLLLLLSFLPSLSLFVLRVSVVASGLLSVVPVLLLLVAVELELSREHHSLLHQLIVGFLELGGGLRGGHGEPLAPFEYALQNEPHEVVAELLVLEQLPSFVSHRLLRVN